MGLFAIITDKSKTIRSKKLFSYVLIMLGKGDTSFILTRDFIKVINPGRNMQPVLPDHFLVFDDVERAAGGYRSQHLNLTFVK